MQEKRENNTKVIDRIYEYISIKWLTFNKLALELNISNSYFSKMFKNKGSIGSDIIEKILRVHPDLNADWLITGRGTMLYDAKQDLNTDSGNIVPSLNNKEDLNDNEEDVPISNKTLGRMVERLFKLLESAECEIDDLTARLAKYEGETKGIDSKRKCQTINKSHNTSNIA